MKLRLALLEKCIELPECNPSDPARSPLRHLLDDLGLEVKNADTDPEGRVTFTIETLANRGDHLYALGVAREISSRTLSQVKAPPVAPQLTDRKASVPVRKVTEKCMKYALLDMTLPHPMPLRNDVAAILGPDCGKHHSIVDLLNYIQCEMGQPMHAFDQEKVEGEVVVDVATKEEEVEALDGKTYRVPEGSILIKDKRRIIAVAGVIGCANTMVTESTKRVLIEAATFDPISVRKTARAMGKSTDASYAFERGCDPEGILPALKRLVYLTAGSGAGGSGDAAHMVGLTYVESPPAEKRKISVRLSRFRSEFNLPRLEEIEVTARLKNLGYVVEAGPLEKNDRDIKVTVPSWRVWDVENADDIVEDVIRSLSLGRVKAEPPELDYNPPEAKPIERFTQATRPALIGNGFSEVITKGFYSAADAALLDARDSKAGSRHVLVKNAIEATNSHMKVTNVIHLGRLLEENRRMGVESCKVFEQGRFFSKGGADDSKGAYEFESDYLTLAACGRWYDNEWRQVEPLEQRAKLFKGVLASVCRASGHDLTTGTGDHPFLHPGIQASIKCGRSVCGHFGVVHPEISRALGLKEEMLYAEFEIAKMAKLGERVALTGAADFPAIRRDVTLKVGLRENASRAVRFMVEAKAENLASVSIVDDFRKPEEEFRRVTFRLAFQHAERTLLHDEVDRAMEGVLVLLKEKHGMEMAA